MSDTENEPTRSDLRLNVLPSSGKADQLRRELQADAKPPAAETSGTFDSMEPNTPKLIGSSIQQKLLQGKVIEAVRQIFDPEIPVNIYDLGLIYEIDAREDNSVHVKMTLTAPACPVAGTLPGEVEKRIENIPEVKSADVELVWDPPWDRSRMSETAQFDLGFL